MSDTLETRGLNRRLTARATCHLTVRYQAQGEWRAATAMDLTRQGCRLRLGEDLARTAGVTVRFQSGVDGPSVEVSGRVIWSRFEGLSFQAGVQFVEPPDQLDLVLASLASSRRE